MQENNSKRTYIQKGRQVLGRLSTSGSLRAAQTYKKVPVLITLVYYQLLGSNFYFLFICHNSIVLSRNKCNALPTVSHIINTEAVNVLEQILLDMLPDTTRALSVTGNHASGVGCGNGNTPPHKVRGKPQRQKNVPNY